MKEDCLYGLPEKKDLVDYVTIIVMLLKSVKINFWNVERIWHNNILEYQETTAKSVEPIQIWCTIIFEPKMQITAYCTLSPSL